MLIVGLTGGIASGKSTVSRYLAQTHNLPIIDLDRLAREAVEPHTRAHAAIVRAFGPSILRPTGELDRKLLGELIFHDRHARRRLERITHPVIRRKMLLALCKAWWAGCPIVVLDAPLLLETSLNLLCGHILLITWSVPSLLRSSQTLKQNSTEDTQKRRIEARDGLDDRQARARMEAQMPASERAIYADTILPNDDDPKALYDAIDRFVSALRMREGGSVGRAVGRWNPLVALARGAWTMARRWLARRRRKTR